MKFNRIHLILVYIALLACVWLFIPGEVEVFLITDILLLLFTVYLLHTLYKRKFHENPRLNTGLVYILAMMVMMVIGSINYFIVQFIWPSYYFDLHKTNLYWIAGLFCFGIGYILTLKSDQRIVSSHKLFIVDAKLVTLGLAMIGLAGTLLIINAIGSIPIFSGKSLSGVRFTDEMGQYGRLWQTNVFAAVAAFYAIYILKSPYRKFFFFIFIFSSLQLFLFAVRFHYTLVLVAIALIYIFAHQGERIKYRKIVLLLTMLLIVNVVYLSIREKDNPAAKRAHGLNFVQTNILYFTFNEYIQLSQLIDIYKDFRGGKTLLNIPVTFLPYQFWEIFGIKKADVRKDISAIILADELDSKTSTGLRTGIMGEFYVNFGFWGALCMIVIGWIIALLENLIRSIYTSDARMSFVFVLQSIMIYSLVGQIDAISQAGFYVLIVMVPILLLSKKRLLFRYRIPNRRYDITGNYGC